MQPAITRDAIQRHYDRLSRLYRRWWGDHLHHGFFENGESPPAAQIKLMQRLAARAGLQPGSRVLDVGCGVGGSALWLARHFDCSVLGITISPVQADLATASAGELGNRVRFEVRDAAQLDFPPASFDVVWVIECSEHLADKERFIADCARIVKPGGKLALCAWLSRGTQPAQRRLVAEIAQAMLCPSLASMSDYVRWMRDHGFNDVNAEDITRHVAPTWSFCSEILREREVEWLLRLGSDDWRRFAGAFPKMARAYAEGAMAYGMFSATRGLP